MLSPVLVTGSHRSGTTWVGQMLCLSGELGYLYEPFRPRMSDGPGWVAKKFPYWYQYIGPENEQEYFRPMTDLLRMRLPFWEQFGDIKNSRHLMRLLRYWFSSVEYRVCGKKPLLKDPFALFSAEWLAQHFGVQVVVMIRHPAAFAASLKRLNWTFGVHQFQEQPDLMRRYLQDYQAQVQHFVVQPPDIIDTAILVWNMVYDTVAQYQKAHPDWVFLKHEPLAEEPVDGYRRLYQKLGLQWNSRVEMQIAAYSSTENERHGLVDGWNTIRQDSKAARWRWCKLLHPEEITRVRAGTESISALFYDNSDWEPPQS